MKLSKNKSAIKLLALSSNLSTIRIYFGINGLQEIRLNHALMTFKIRRMLGFAADAKGWIGRKGALINDRPP